MQLEDRYRVLVDRANWGDENTTAYDPDGDGVFNTGFVQMIKFSPTFNLKYVDQCSVEGSVWIQGLVLVTMVLQGWPAKHGTQD